MVPGPIGSSLPNHFLSLEITITDKNATWTHTGHVKFEHFEVLIEDAVVDFAPLHAELLPPPRSQIPVLANGIPGPVGKVCTKGSSTTVEGTMHELTCIDGSNLMKFGVGIEKLVSHF